jgi:hypothetical protein
MATWKKIVLEENITGAGPISVSSSAFSLSVSGLSPAGTPSGNDQLLSWNGSEWETVNASEFLGAAGAAITTFTNGSDDRVVTATSASGANAESKLTFSDSALEVISPNSSSSGIKLYGGVVGAAAPYISPVGSHSILKFGDGVSGHVYDFQQNKIAFDNDSTNTYIAANSETPEDLEVHADQDILLKADNETVVDSDLRILGQTVISEGITGGQSSFISIKERTVSSGGASSAGSFGIGSDILHLGSTSSVNAGYFYYLNQQSGWSGASALSNTRAAYGLICMATGSNVSDGMASKGVFYTATDPGGYAGDPVYLSASTGRLTSTAPSSTGNVVRVMGHKVGTNLVYFDPDKYWRVV